MTDYIALLAIPVAGWTINKVVTHERDIATLKQVAVDIRDSLKRLEVIFDQGQTWRHPEEPRHSRSPR